MNKFVYFLFIVIAAFIIGIAAGAFLNGGITACTEMACFCEEEGEIRCNTCAHEDPVFVLGIVNVMNVCDSREILICKDNQAAQRRYETEGNCRTEWKWFDFVLDYME